MGGSFSTARRDVLAMGAKRGSAAEAGLDQEVEAFGRHGPLKGSSRLTGE
jgi:hypothetical protein